MYFSASDSNSLTTIIIQSIKILTLTMQWGKMLFQSITFFFFFFFLLFRAAPKAYGSFQARGQIGAAAAGLYHSHRIRAMSVTYIYHSL